MTNEINNKRLSWENCKRQKWLNGYDAAREIAMLQIDMGCMNGERRNKENEWLDETHP